MEKSFEEAKKVIEKAISEGCGVSAKIEGNFLKITYQKYVVHPILIESGDREDIKKLEKKYGKNI